MALRLLSGSSHPDFDKLLRQRIGYETGSQGIQSSRFSNGETFVSIDASVRGADVFILQTASNPVNDGLMELLIAISACRMASAKRITAIIPCFPYARQDRKDRSRAPITAKVVATMLESVGCDHIICKKTPRIVAYMESFLRLPIQLYAERTMTEHIKKEYKAENLVIVSPDAGGTKRAAAIADALHVDLAIIHKERKIANKVSRMILVGNVRGKTAVIVDDIADTCGTLAMAAKLLKDEGTERCDAIVTHGFLSGPSITVIQDSDIDELVVSNTLPLPENARGCSKIRQVDISHTFAEAIRRTHNGESISMLF